MGPPVLVGRGSDGSGKRLEDVIKETLGSMRLRMFATDRGLSIHMRAPNLFQE
jgi:hypothetical protein